MKSFKNKTQWELNHSFRNGAYDHVIIRIPILNPTGMFQRLLSSLLILKLARLVRKALNNEVKSLLNSLIYKCSFAHIHVNCKR